MGTTKKIKFGEFVLMNVSAIYGIRWIAKSTADSFGLGLAGIPSWVIFMFLCFVPQALMCAELAAAYTSDGSLGEWVKIAFGTKYGFLISWLNWTRQAVLVCFIPDIPGDQSVLYVRKPGSC